MAAGSAFHFTPDRFTVRRISEKASTTINAWVTALANDELSLAALPAPLFSLYNLGVMDGRGQMQGELRTARLDADRLWLRAFGDEERKDYLLQRLNVAAVLADRPDVDDVLDEAWHIYVSSLDAIRKPVTLATTTEDLGATCDHAA
ncbi:hypothetical protein [uncultured Microbacterium sp.]|uniref:hypothetical protein n=1 Tax=Microbacterium algeriense TaxID=2615184 RepID=UPI00259279EC|nr:hypothetical protein [uncultured Microbacterium sp.]